MNYQNFPNEVLLAILLGHRMAKRRYKGTLTPLFVPESGPGTGEPKLHAAHELVKRWCEEVLRRDEIFTSPAATRRYLQTLFADKAYESFIVLFLDSRHRLISSEEMFKGTIDTASVHPREVVRRALQLNTAAVIIAHNHPSGIAEPSRADELLTQRIKESLALVDVRLLDHFVVGNAVEISLAERGLM